MLKYLFRYAGVGTAVYCLGLLEYHLLYTIFKNMPNPATLSWLAGFVVGTPWAHALHRRFTFVGEACKIPYLRSLLRTYGAYALSTASGAMILYFGCDMGPLPVLIGWGISAVTGSFLNFFLLSQYAIRNPDGERYGSSGVST